VILSLQCINCYHSILAPSACATLSNLRYTMANSHTSCLHISTCISSIMSTNQKHALPLIHISILAKSCSELTAMDQIHIQHSIVRESPPATIISNRGYWENFDFTSFYSRNIAETILYFFILS